MGFWDFLNPLPDFGDILFRLGVAFVLLIPIPLFIFLFVPGKFLKLILAGISIIAGIAILLGWWVIT